MNRSYLLPNTRSGLPLRMFLYAQLTQTTVLLNARIYIRAAPTAEGAGVRRSRL